MGTTHIQQRAESSSRLDWLSVSLFGATESAQRQQLAYCFFLAENTAQGGEWQQGAGRRFFSNSLYHPSGIQVRWTTPDEEGMNRGLVSLDLKGDALAALDAEQRKAVYLDFAEMDGFKQCSRLDSQVTVVNPHATAEFILQQVRKRQVWIKGFSSYGEPAEKDQWGNPMTGATITWGSSKGATRCRTYNKQAEANWDQPAVRHEVQLRKQPARDRFNSLVELLRLEGDQTQTAAEAHFVQSVLDQHMAYLDTNRLAQRSDQDGWPANWVRDSNKADWWKEVVTVVPTEMKTKWRLTKALEDAVEARDKQYGRISAKWIAKRVWIDGAALADARNEELTRAFVRMKDEDIEEVCALVPEEEQDKARKWMKEYRRRAAKRAEELPFMGT